MSSHTLEIQEQIQSARQDRDPERLAALVEQAFSEAGADEQLLAWVAQVAYEEDLEPSGELFPRFLAQFPDSTHQVRVFLADTMAEQGLYDSSSEEARAHLDGLRREAGLEAAARNPQQADWLLHALHLLPASLIAAGARHRAQEIYGQAMALSSDPGWTLNFEQEIGFLDRELSEYDNREVDYHWRRFFETGESLDLVLQACAEKELPLLAARTRLLHEVCSGAEGWSLDPDCEFWLLESDGQGGHRFSARD